MEAVNFRDLFKTNCYKPTLEKLIGDISNDFSQSTEVVVKSFLDPLDAFLQVVIEHQKKGIIEPVKRVCISLLRTSLYLQKPVLLVEAYEEIPFVVKPVMSCELNAAWMFSHWTAFQEKLQESTQQQSLGRYVRKPELKSYESKAAASLLRFFTLYLKYAVRELENRRIYSSLKEIDNFTISFGEYMDWQIPLIMWRQNLDVFLCEENDDLTFRNFHKLFYENKQFPARDMDDCVFSDCVFRNTVFQGTKLRNVRFTDCTFEDCKFEEAELMGSSILSSRLKKVVFQKCRILGGFHKDGLKTFLYPNGKFKWSLLEEIQWIDTDTTDEIYVDCQLFDVV